jgi:hypothetical protein
MTLIKCNNFVKRQTMSSPFSYYCGTWEDLEELAYLWFDDARPGYKEGVQLITVPARGFFSGLVQLVPQSADGLATPLVAEFKPRAPGEDAVVAVTARGAKQPAAYVDLVIYAHDVLVEEGSASTDAAWEIISINARVAEAPEPMLPVTMMRNFLGKTGGTRATYTAEEFAASIEFWSKHAMKAE